MICVCDSSIPQNELQTFKLPESVLFGGDVLLVKMLVRVKEKEDNLFDSHQTQSLDYITMCFL